MKFAILGYGISGKAAERLIKQKYGTDRIAIFDDKLSEYRDINECRFQDYDRVVVSPGIALSGIKGIDYSRITSELELAAEHIENDAAIIGITGTNGKSTITHLSTQMLTNSGIKAVSCGNIGKTLSDAVMEYNYDMYVVELSSFQIDLLNNFRLDAFCICNITPDHMERYESYDSYVKSKLKAVTFCSPANVYLPEDNIFQNYDLPEGIRYIDNNLESYPSLSDNIMDFGDFEIDISGFNLIGKHNLVNLSFSLSLVSSVVLLKGDVSYLIKNLSALEHRLEKFAVIGGVNYINDSKSTNVESTITALNSLKPAIILIMGGRAKKSDYSQLTDIINKKVKKLILYGEAAQQIFNSVKDKLTVDCVLCESLAEATDYASDIAVKGDYVVLSPGCSSFDSFNNFEERGHFFKNRVKTMNKEKAANV